MATLLSTSALNPTPVDTEFIYGLDAVGAEQRTALSTFRSSVAGLSVSGSRLITVTLSAQQQTDGFTTAHVSGLEYEIVNDAAADIALIGGVVSSKTSTVLVYRLTGNETISGGQQITVFLQK